MSLRTLKNIFIQEDLKAVDLNKLNYLSKKYKGETRNMSPKDRKEFYDLMEQQEKFNNKLMEITKKDLKMLPYLLGFLMILACGFTAFLSYSSHTGVLHSLLDKKVVEQEVKKIAENYYTDDENNPWIGNNYGLGDKFVGAYTMVYKDHLGNTIKTEQPVWKGKNGKVYANKEEARKN